MRGLWQVIVVILSLGSWASAQAGRKPQGWKPLELKHSVFNREIGLLDSERDDYASELTAIALNRMAAAGYSSASMQEGRRMIALALHLSPRNKRALVANFQLTKGITPEPVASGYSEKSFALLLLARCQMLKTQDAGDNLLLRRSLAQMAAELDPKNEDAVYLSEIERLQHGAFDWALLTDPANE